MVFAPLGKPDHAVVSVSTDFPSNSKGIAPFYGQPYDYSHADWDHIHGHLRDITWEDIFKLGASAATTELYD